MRERSPGVWELVVSAGRDVVTGKQRQVSRTFRGKAQADLVDDPYVFTDALDGAEPWKPDAVSQYFGRLRQRAGLDKVQFHQLRKFMETYGQEMGYSVTQVAMRAGHDPSIAAKHYSGRVSETDRALAEAVASLIAPQAIG